MRTQLLQETLLKEHEYGSVVLKRLSKESFPLYDSNGQHVLDIDASGLDLFVVANFSVHILVWVKTNDGIKCWVPRRAGQMSYPNMLDNTVGGSRRT
ncbi:putative thiamin pyrophosphokinase-related protein [Diaporthe ampelina]|uniref:Putative thiamin pyrophosphokinase-related protein n=1 Tax=Diaporthe ampelina TaxID=1214573 RepID=A0A0G2F4X1_9PEZI|nr:putative thiamin pyrophosphokinase-related protein [Diaporthe ampelina]